MANLRDVARLANVGVGTVSRALNGSGYISQETKQKIDAAIKELDYTPNELARNLFRKRSGIIGVVIPDIENPFFSKVVKYIETELYKHDYKTMLCNTTDISNREKDYIDMLKRNMVDGIITGSHSLHDEAYLNTKKPIVGLDRDLGPTVPLIHSDHEKGGRMAAQRLAEAGCKSVLQFRGSYDVKSPSSVRHIGFEDYMREHNIKVETVEMEWNMLNYDYYFSLMQKHTEQYHRVDGIFAPDIGAMYGLQVALQRGIKVPEDLKIIGYDATEITRLTFPHLTAVRQDVQGLAKCCVDTLIDLIDEKEDIQYHQILDVTLQEGDTA